LIPGVEASVGRQSLGVWTDDYDLFIDRELVVVRWRSPTVASARGLHPLIERHYQELGSPLFFAAIVGPDCPPPDNPTREALLRGYDRIYECCRTVRMVVIGSSWRQTVMRSVITAMTLAAGLRGKAFAVDKTIGEMARVAEETLGRSAEQIIAALGDAGLVTPDELG
jgi:hypothetical protein